MQVKALDSENLPRYPYANQLKRHFHFNLGPTNSGKTHDALIALQQAASGVYLAPLRLLAMEIRDRLMQAGIPCHLVTGEERQYVPGAQHTASTIEMMLPDHPVDVAVIDEIQMLQDPERGYAWTNALLGVPAKQVYVCGANSVTPACLRLLDTLGATYEINHYERKTPLILEEHALSGQRYHRAYIKKRLQKGDAVVVFSRKDALTLSARFRQWGFSIATIYGALSPEVRRTESNRFNEGKADILVATDAIGMGLNLPIRRIVFSSIEKFDGQATRILNPTETRQIAGRAGRYGIYPTGFVNTFEQDDLRYLDHLLSTSDVVEMDKLPIAPQLSSLQSIAGKLHTHKLSELLQYFSERLRLQSDLFALAPLDAQIAIAELVDIHAPQLALKQKLTLSCAPVSLDKAHERDYFIQCLHSIAHQQARQLPQTTQWLDANTPKHLEAAENLSKDISLYAWLSHKFPAIFADNQALPTLRARTNRYIEQALLTQSGYQITMKESMLAHPF